MIPIIWRYLLQGYLRVFSLSVWSFIAILLVSRFKDIARFMALSGSWMKTVLFASYQIPLILPLAIPISALISSLLLFQRLSKSYELVAMRAAGISLFTLISPLLFTSLLLSFANFSMQASISPYCRRATKTLLYDETSANPLLLLQRQNLIKMKNAYINMKVKKEGMIADDLILITQNERHQRLNLFSAKHLKITKEMLLGHDVAIVSYLPNEKEDSFDSLVIENQSSMSTAAPILSASLKKNRPRLDMGALDLKMLKFRSAESKKQKLSAYVELLRRTTLSLAVFSFTLLGAAFGFVQTRNPSKKGILIAFGLSLMLLTSYLLGKELKSLSLIATFAFLTPHPLIWAVSFFKLRKIAKGTL